MHIIQNSDGEYIYIKKNYTLRVSSFFSIIKNNIQAKDTLECII